MVNVAILGYGVVGSGVAEVIHKNANHISEKAANEITVKYVLDVRDFPDAPFGMRFVKDFSIIENDPEVQVVVETIGGTGAALEFTKRCLAAGKNVVTSNKELVAEYGYELLHMARERNLNYLFEASVGGGIPIIRPISQCLAANELNEVYGILNGTTNYILTRMVRAGLTFQDALREAQAKGYAEKDPTADIEGYDACRKICILSALSFGSHVYPRQVATEGISKITLRDVGYAESGKRKIKLLGRAVRLPDGKISAYVAPHLVPDGSSLSNVEDVFNGIVVKGDAIGDVMFYGRGAGKFPTASAVVADVIDAAKHFKARKYLDWLPGGDDVTVDSAILPTRWYIRANATQEQAGNSFGEIEMLRSPDAPAGEIAFLTAEFNKREIETRGTDLDILARIRVLG
ncbi:homoserine dehydrogenase [Papillibacter cinnamivorans]|uniref:Homoserine dehydrogenase n=1 Tax=Papillibacter cinnamivorans DSM 12816 TaxID=1122930 RepID=A0A1W1Z144_9FIRM|nr:homoserine dehydrogenase [Papillibacter cinnamivorans]SMC42104.1 homoserine dehydrogenase [Papillibacter cinnamivorans DSM 12816]